MCSPNILSGSGCFAGSRGVKESAAEPSRVASLKTEGFAEYSRLVPAARVLRIQAIVLDLADIEMLWGAAARKLHPSSLM
jgi:hypothetical protein